MGDADTSTVDLSYLRPPIRALSTGAEGLEKGRPAVLLLLPLLALYLSVTAIAAPGPQPVGDEGPLLAYASRLLHGGYAIPGTMDAVSYLWHGPGIPLMLAPLKAIGMPLAVMRFSGPILLFGAVLVFHRLLRLRLASGMALAGACALGLYAPFLTSLPSIHKEPLTLLTTSLAALWLAHYLTFGRRRDLLRAGIALGVTAMVRVEYGWIIIAMLVFFACWGVRVRARALSKRVAAVLAVALVCCLPWLAYTFDLTAHPLYWGNSGGSSLYWMSPTSGPGETGQWHSGHAVFREPRLARYRPYSIRLGQLTPLERDLELQRSAIANIRAQPLLYLRNLVANSSRLWFMLPYSPAPPAGALLLYGVFNLLLLIGLGWAARILIKARRRLPPEAVPLAALAATGLIVHVLPSAEPRLALPLVLPLVWLISYAASVRSGRVTFSRTS